jgi:hypothetical protein
MKRAVYQASAALARPPAPPESPDGSGTLCLLDRFRPPETDLDQKPVKQPERQSAAGLRGQFDKSQSHAFD